MNLISSHVSIAAHGRNVVNCLQFNADWMITGSDDCNINVYDTPTTKLHATLRGHRGGVWALEFIRKTLVSGSTDSTIRVWDIEKGECTHVFSGHASTIRCLRILQPVMTGTDASGKPTLEPSYPIIVTGSRDCSVRVWRLPDLQQDAPECLATDHSEAENSPFFLRALLGHTGCVRDISGHGNLLISGSYDSFVNVWQIDTGKCVFRLAGHQAKVYSVAIDSKRARCISGSMDHSVKVWGLDSGSCLYTLEGHTSLVGLVALYENILVSASADSTLRVWDADSGQCLHELAGHIGAIVCFRHNDKIVISGGDDAIKLWDVQTGNFIKDLVSDLNRVWQVKFDDHQCVAAVQKGSFTFLEILHLDHYPSLAELSVT
ncbi:WD40-repeat-containing domain protein [Lipomyces kononenkoae]|uniref:WD40-repeat-containing domain protein n=1 Tax=Lipomyces kononenkoae TaxID=34357 RepID=A0ACC3T0R5_LIPKO